MLPEDLPPEKRARLRQALRRRRDAGFVSPSLDLSLRDRGYVFHQDAHGLRFGGDIIGRGPGTGRLTPLDVIRLAAELDGGLPGEDEKTVCPQCQAVVTRTEPRCTWCGHVFNPSREEPPSPQPD